MSETTSAAVCLLSIVFSRFLLRRIAQVRCVLAMPKQQQFKGKMSKTVITQNIH